MTCTPAFGEGETIGFRVNDGISLMSPRHFDQIDIDQAADELTKRGLGVKFTKRSSRCYFLGFLRFITTETRVLKRRRNPVFRRTDLIGIIST
jgi:hypothetical protein